MTFQEAVQALPQSPDTTKPAVSFDFVAVCAALAASAAAFAGAAPTGTGWWDVILRALFAAAFVVAAASSPHWILAAATAITTLGVGATPWLVVSTTAAVVGLFAYSRPPLRNRLVPIVAALTIQALLHLQPVGFFGLPSLIVGIIAIAMFVGALDRADRRTRSIVRRLGVAIALALGVVLVGSAYMAVSIRSTADSGVSAARRGLDLARGGDTAGLTVELERAEAQLADADGRLRGVAFKPLSLVPVVAQHHRSLSTAATQGALVAGQAASSVREANVAQLEFRAGSFDLGLLASMAPRLEQTKESLQVALREIERHRSPWVVPQVDRQLQSLVDEVAAVLPEATLSADAARLLPPMLGADQERRYLMLFGQPGESREFGGFIGGYALIGINDGALDLVAAGSIIELEFFVEKEEFANPDDYPVEFIAVDPSRFPQNLTATPNMQVIAAAVREIFPELYGAPIDGVIYADPFALAAMTEFTGPLFVEGLTEPLGQQALLDFMFQDQYRDFESRSARFDVMGELASATAAAFEQADLPGPEEVGRVLGPAARAGRLQIVTYDQDENIFLESVKLQRQFVAPTAADSLAVIQTNGTASKLDLYLRREVDYDVTVGPDDTLTAEVEVRLRSDIPADAPELTFGDTDGTNRVLLSLYSRHELESLSVNGQSHEYVTHTEFGFFRYALFAVELEPNTSATVNFSLRGQAPDVIANGYRLAVWSQPLVNPDLVQVTYRAAGEAPVTQSKFLDENWLLSIPQ